MTHAITLTGFNRVLNIEVKRNIRNLFVRWRVENSWGDDRGDKGFLLMTTDWFKVINF